MTRGKGVPGRLAAVVVIVLSVSTVALCVVVGAGSASPPRSNLRFSDGAVQVHAVATGDVLDAAGVAPGDEIVALDGRPVTSGLDCADHFAGLSPGEPLVLTVLRGGSTLRLEVTAWRNLPLSRLLLALLPIAALLAAGTGVVAARPRDLPAFLFLLYCVTAAINNACQLPPVAGTGCTQRLITAAYTLVSLHSPALLLHLFVVFPERGRVQRLASGWLPLGYGIQLSLGLAYYLPTVTLLGAELLRSAALHRALFTAFGVNVVVCYGLSALSLGAASRRGSTDRVRRQARLLFFAIALLTLLQVGLVEVPVRLTGRTLLPTVAQTYLDLVVPAAVLVAILRHRLFGIDLLVRRGLIYAASTVATVVLFVAVTAGVAWGAQRLWTEPRLVAVAVAAGVAAITFPLLRRRSRDWVDRVLYRRRYSHRQVLSEVADRLTTPLGAEGVALLLATRIAEALAADEVVVAVQGPTGGFDSVAVDGTLHPWCSVAEAEAVAGPSGSGGGTVPAAGALPGRDDWALTVPVVYRDRLLALMVLGPRRDGVPYVPEDVELLAALARLAAPSLADAALAGERADRHRLAALGSAAAAVAHELKNPLAAIRSTAAILRRRLPEDPRGRELTCVVEEEAERLERSVGEVLTFVRPGRREPEPVELGELVSRLVAVVRPEFDLAGVEIGLHAGRQVVRGDPARLRQAVLNLLLNARDAMPAGGRVEVEIAPCQDGDTYVEVTVADTGAGFADDALEHAFEPFFTTKRLGTGLGLANVRRVVEEHGGEVRLGNRPAGGAVIRLRLPLYDEWTG